MTYQAPQTLAENHSEDFFLGGKVVVYQPIKGRHRSGCDAVLLAASLPGDLVGHGYDFGSASGAAGLCLTARVPTLSVTLVDLDDAALALGAAALQDRRNAHCKDRVDLLRADLCAKEKSRMAAGLTRESADFVICNPPYHRQSEVRASPQQDKAAAHVLGTGGFLPWIKAAASALKPGGLAAFIIRAEALPLFLSAFDPRFGDIVVLPLHPYPEVAASHLIIQGRKGRKGLIRFAFPWILRQRSKARPKDELSSSDGPQAVSPVDQGYTAETEAVLRHGVGLNIASRL